jgi:hypothetical protein
MVLPDLATGITIPQNGKAAFLFANAHQMYFE